METANDVEGGLNPQAPEQSESEPITSQPTIEPYMASDATILDGDEMNQDSADEENDSETACPEEACVPNMPFGGIPTMAVRFFTTLTAGTIAIVMVFFYPLLFSLLILFAADVGKDGEATGLMGLIPTAHTRVSFLILGNAVGTGYVAWSPTLILCWKLIPVFSSRGLCKYVKHPAPFAPHLVLAAISAVGLTLAALIARAATSSGAQPCNMGNVSVWWTGRQPQTFMGCEDRLAPEQQALLREHVYQVQFPRVEHLSDYIWNATFDMDPFLQVHQNQTLCSRGFRGDQDLYGLGTRLGVYLLWLAGLVSNTLLPEKQDEPRKAWLFSSLIISSTCLVLSSTRECTFSTDITILYYMYWGGYLCVYTSVPGRAHVNGAPTWVRLNGARIARYVSAFFMLVHSMWFLWYGYDQVFARLPCGTWHLLPVSLMDPSPAFCTARDTLVGVTGPLYWLLSCAIPWFMMLFLSEIRHYFGKSLLPESEAEEDRFTSVARYLERRVMSWQGRYRVFRYWAGLPPHTRGGIYLVTPVGIKYRRIYRVFTLLFGIASLCLAVAAIERTLILNKITGTTSLDTPGQFMPLTLGVLTCSLVVWQLFMQESMRRRELSRQSIFLRDNMALSSFGDVLRHAWEQADIDFYLDHGGVLPTTNGDGTPPLRSSVDITETFQDEP